MIMASTSSVDSDPFVDPSVNVDEVTLNVGRNASLTLGTESLIVLGKF